MPESYVRSTDGSVMVEYAPGMFTSARMAVFLGLMGANIVKAVERRYRLAAAA